MLGSSANRVFRNVAVPHPVTGAPAELTLGGIALFDSTPFGGSVPTKNSVTDNAALHNKPFDVFSDGSGSNNILRDNRCTKSTVAGACEESDDRQLTG